MGIIVKNIVLVGFMGTGKTNVGRLISQELNMEYVNTDDLIEKKEGMSINDIFSKKGEPYFRQVESEVIKEVSQKDSSLIDAGGGVVTSELNVKGLKQKGIIFCLNATPEEILKRTKRYSHRPLLNVADPLAEIKVILKNRTEYYKRADYQIETTGKTADEVSKEIIGIYNKTKV